MIFFHHSCRKGHCLNHLFTVKLRPSGATPIRARGHDYELFNQRNFIVRLLFLLCVIFFVLVLLVIVQFLFYFIL